MLGETSFCVSRIDRGAARFGGGGPTSCAGGVLGFMMLNPPGCMGAGMGGCWGCIEAAG